MFCKNCGSEIPDGSTVCPNCGGSVTPEATDANGSSDKKFGFGGVNLNPSSLSMEKIKSLNIVGLVASVLLILATFLPYITVSAFGMSESESLFGYLEGKVYIIVAVVAITFIIKRFDLPVIIAAVVGVGFMIYDIIDMGNAMDEIGYMSSMVKKGFGYYLMIISNILLLVSPFINKIISAVKSKMQA